MKTLLLLLFLLVISLYLHAQKFVAFEIEGSDFGFGRTAKVAENESLDFVVNGPLVHSDGKIVGGYVDKGIQRQDWVEPDTTNPGNFHQRNGIFGRSIYGEMMLIPYDEWNDNYRLLWGFQNGMILLLNGINDHNPHSNNRYYRSGIGFRSDNILVVIVSLDMVTYWELANKFRELNCTHAIYLDGYESLHGVVGYTTSTESVGMSTEYYMKLQFFHTKIKKL